MAVSPPVGLWVNFPHSIQPPRVPVLPHGPAWAEGAGSTGHAGGGEELGTHKSWSSHQQL